MVATLAMLATVALELSSNFFPGSDLSCLWSRHVRGRQAFNRGTRNSDRGWGVSFECSGVRTEVANARGTVLRVEEDFKISSYVWAGDAQL